ncbi:conserved protein, unknown function [Plasmodium relictum]|uniref:PPPDE domain-containing protein n=1 Tax=Plasmodium relictum TaxID=85471 RepID=A0A1J1HBD7_PLARL|nr:conserved protein, unknown function [Plasmodium relictum]CRH02607.1 conserved protein, unknown function [Plasmodium relictum]
MISYSVKLKIYDLSRGMVKTWSPLLIGKQIEGVWHTAVLVYDMEYFYGGGILCLDPKEFEAFYDIKPVNIIDMGTTEIYQSHFHEYLNGIQKDFTVDKYNLVSWNCNNFTNEVCNFLVGKNIPQYILNTPYDVMSTSKGKLILDMMQSYQTMIAPGLENNPIENNKSNENKSVDNKKEFHKLPSVTLDNFFDDNKIEKLIEEFTKNDKYNSNQKNKFLNTLKNFLDNIIKNLDNLEYRVLYKKNCDTFNNLSTISEYNEVLSSIGFFQGYIEIDEVNNLEKFTIFIDSKSKMHSFAEHLDLFINKKIFLKNQDETTSKIYILNFKDLTDYIPCIERKKSNSNDILIFMSEAFINNNFDITNEKNEVTYFNTIKENINADPYIEKKFLLSTSEILKKNFTSLSSLE